MKRTLSAVLTATLVGGLAAASYVSTAEARPQARAERAALPKAFGLTAGGQLVRVSLGSADTELVGDIKGLRKGDRVIGIDVRPSNGELYAVGRDGGLYVVNTKNAKADRVGALGVTLVGTSFGVDFNPAADALRVVSNRGQNLRYTFDPKATTADAPLNVPDTDPRVQGIAAAAYTNNDNDDATGTALYDLNIETDAVVLQVPANAGTITSQGPLRAGAGVQAGFDIFTRVKKGKATANLAYATLGNKRGYALYRVDVTSGKAARVGAFGPPVVDIAVVPAV